jgi:polyhydroxyalkanoate synthesis regulator phasin
MCAGLFAAALLAAGGLYIVAKVGQYAQAVAEADDRSAQQAAALREDVSKQLESLSPAMPQDSVRLSEIKRQIDAQEAELSNEIIPRMKQLRDDLGAARPSLCDRPPLAEGPDALRGQLNCLKARIADIEENTRSKPIGGVAEDDLSPKQWLQIQKD